MKIVNNSKQNAVADRRQAKKYVEPVEIKQLDFVEPVKNLLYC